MDELTGYILESRSLTGEINSSGELEGSISIGDSLTGSFSLMIPTYDGVYSVTPSEETQTLLTKNKNLNQNITIEAIPSNYGWISYNGSTLTVY